MKTIILKVLLLLCCFQLKETLGDSSCSKSVCYNEVLKASKNGTMIIDVRPKQDVAETGLIPSSINIPLTCLRVKMELNKSQFKNDYNCTKPKKKDLIIITGCQNVSNTDAIEILCVLGYKRVVEYLGGYEEFNSKGSDCKSEPEPNCDNAQKEACKVLSEVLSTPPPPPPPCPSQPPVKKPDNQTCPPPESSSTTECDLCGKTHPKDEPCGSCSD